MGVGFGTMQACHEACMLRVMHAGMLGSLQRRIQGVIAAGDCVHQDSWPACSCVAV